jgi:putative restriction endonuclease
MKDQGSNLMLQKVLLDTYFPETSKNYLQHQVVPKDLFTKIETKILEEDPVEYKTETRKLLEEDNEEELFLRGSIFKREIPRIYHYACCISGMKIHSMIPVTLVDACHIVPFSRSYDDTISNGIALCPNLHRAFDRGLITIDPDYRVRVSGEFTEERSIYSIRALQGHKILLPVDKKYFPGQVNLEWHRENLFRN